MKKQNPMDGDSRYLEKNFAGQPSDLVHDDSAVLQSVRVRRGPVLANPSNWEFVASECRVVFYSGIFLWTLYLLSLAL
jgi:hypothetical protein